MLHSHSPIQRFRLLPAVLSSSDADNADSSAVKWILKKILMIPFFETVCWEGTNITIIYLLEECLGVSASISALTRTWSGCTTDRCCIKHTSEEEVTQKIINYGAEVKERNDEMFQGQI